MGSLYFDKDRSPEMEASKALETYARGVCDLELAVCFERDDGGKHIVLYIETEDPSETLPDYLKDVLQTSQWMGWRLVLMKVPLGMIETMKGIGI